MTKKTRDLCRQLHKAVMDHVSDYFLETSVPLLVLIEAAKNGNEKEVKEYAQVFVYRCLLPGIGWHLGHQESSADDKDP
uniref:Uncharacterized protein n=1 Tax=Callithrix jacchus TaxID=9483 RepID=A0A8I3XD61_CALJA